MSANDHNGNLERVMVTELERRRDKLAEVNRAVVAAVETLEVARTAVKAGHAAQDIARAEVEAMCSALKALGYRVPRLAGPDEEEGNGGD